MINYALWNSTKKASMVTPIFCSWYLTIKCQRNSISTNAFVSIFFMYMFLFIKCVDICCTKMLNKMHDVDLCLNQIPNVEVHRFHFN